MDGVSLIPYLEGDKGGDPHSALYWRKMDSYAVREGDYKLILTRGVDTVLYDLSTDIVESNDLFDIEEKQSRKLLKKLTKWEDKYCITPMWIEDGWAPITNGYHQRLMNNEITYTIDLFNKKKKK